ncbi:MAG TPA: hypothetical protein VGN88_00290, partial [Phycisphaerae bacterium]
MKRSLSSVFVAALLASVTSQTIAGTVGFEEDFALAPDRTVPLKQLIPGTADYYYYNCLQFENTADYAKAQETLDAWIARNGRDSDPRIAEMENRQALLT